jgi:SAM-dependent methyltransferase
VSPYDRARRYHRSRPGYCPQVVRFVAHRTGGRIATVADIGCGTGLSTRPFRELADTLIGVEPDPCMRAVADGYLSDTDARVLDGSAESTGLGTSTVDLLVAASCFGGFDLPRAAREFRRVLRPGGSVLLMWHYPALVDAAGYDWERLWRRHMGPRLGPSREDVEQLLVPAFLAAGRGYFRCVDHHSYQRRRLHDLAWSSRYAPGEPHEGRRRALTEAIDQFFERHHTRGSVGLAYQTVAVLGTLHDRAARL